MYVLCLPVELGDQQQL